MELQPELLGVFTASLKLPMMMRVVPFRGALERVTIDPINPDAAWASACGAVR